MKGNYFMLLCLLANILNALCQETANVSEGERYSFLELNDNEEKLVLDMWKDFNKPSFFTSVVINMFQHYLKIGKFYPVADTTAVNLTAASGIHLLLEGIHIQNHITTAISKSNANYDYFYDLGKYYAKEKNSQSLQYWIIQQEEIMKKIRQLSGTRFSAEKEMSWTKVLSKIWEPIFNGYYAEMVRQVQHPNEM